MTLLQSSLKYSRETLLVKLDFFAKYMVRFGLDLVFNVTPFSRTCSMIIREAISPAIVQLSSEVSSCRSCMKALHCPFSTPLGCPIRTEQRRRTFPIDCEEKPGFSSSAVLRIFKEFRLKNSLSI